MCAIRSSARQTDPCRLDRVVKGEDVAHALVAELKVSTPKQLADKISAVRVKAARDTNAKAKTTESA